MSRSRRWRPLLLVPVIAGLGWWIPNVSRPGDEVLGCLNGCATTNRRGDGGLRVLSLNVLHDFPRFDSLPQRLELIAGEILRLGAEVVLLQEVPWTGTTGHGAKLLAERVGMNYVYLRANGNRRAIGFEEGEAILSAYPLSSPTFAELLPRAGYFEHRVVLHAIASTPEGDIHFHVTHLSGEERIGPGQVESLMAFTDALGGPAVLAGDFNALESSPRIVALASLWVDAYRAIHPNQPGYTGGLDDLHAGPEETFEQRIDYVFVSPDLLLLDAGRFADQPFAVPEGWLWVSDHAGLWIDNEIP
jgi:endonuclease/exonuclease/phosphatase family metal-dependent hydrolase